MIFHEDIFPFKNKPPPESSHLLPNTVIPKPMSTLDLPDQIDPTPPLPPQTEIPLHHLDPEPTPEPPVQLEPAQPILDPHPDPSQVIIN